MYGKDKDEIKHRLCNKNSTLDNLVDENQRIGHIAITQVYNAQANPATRLHAPASAVKVGTILSFCDSPTTAFQLTSPTHAFVFSKPLTGESAA